MLRLCLGYMSLLIEHIECSKRQFVEEITTRIFCTGSLNIWNYSNDFEFLEFLELLKLSVHIFACGYPSQFVQVLIVDTVTRAIQKQLHAFHFYLIWHLLKSHVHWVKSKSSTLWDTQIIFYMIRVSNVRFASHKREGNRTIDTHSIYNLIQNSGYKHPTRQKNNLSLDT